MTNKPSSGAAGGDNKIHQIVMAVITTIAAPVIVFFVTNNLKNSTAPTPTLIVQVITATAPAVPPEASATQPENLPTAIAGTEVVKATSKPTSTPKASAAATATATQTPTIQPTATSTTTARPTQTATAQPAGTIPAGTPVLINGLELTISAQDLKPDAKTIGILVHVKNTTAEKQTLSFTPGSITIKDNTGHIYAPLYGDKKNGCKKEALNAAHKVEIEAKGEVILASVSPDKTGGWCVENSGSAIPRFAGPLSRNAKKIQVQINGLGPFDKIQIEIGL